MSEFIGCDGPRGRSRSGAPVPKAKGTPGCPARAYVHAKFEDGRELHYCGHHGTEYIDRLREVAKVTDNRDRILTGDDAAEDVPAAPAKEGATV